MYDIEQVARAAHAASEEWKQKSPFTTTPVPWSSLSDSEKAARMEEARCALELQPHEESSTFQRMVRALYAVTLPRPVHVDWPSLTLADLVNNTSGCDDALRASPRGIRDAVWRRLVERTFA